LAASVLGHIRTASIAVREGTFNFKSQLDQIVKPTFGVAGLGLALGWWILIEFVGQSHQVLYLRTLIDIIF
jgi:hypothetical protein